MMSELPQSDFWLPVREPEHLSITNIIDISTSEYKKVSREMILKRKSLPVEEAKEDKENIQLRK